VAEIQIQLNRWQRNQLKNWLLSQIFQVSYVSKVNLKINTKNRFVEKVCIDFALKKSFIMSFGLFNNQNSYIKSFLN
jgi:hypothetical protein